MQLDAGSVPARHERVNESIIAATDHQRPRLTTAPRHVLGHRRHLQADIGTLRTVPAATAGTSQASAARRVYHVNQTTVFYSKLDAEHSIECKLTPATRSPSTEICFALCDSVTLTFDLLT